MSDPYAFSGARAAPASERLALRAALAPRPIDPTAVYVGGRCTVCRVTRVAANTRGSRCFRCEDGNPFKPPPHVPDTSDAGHQPVRPTRRAAEGDRFAHRIEAPSMPRDTSPSREESIRPSSLSRMSPPPHYRYSDE